MNLFGRLRSSSSYPRRASSLKPCAPAPTSVPTTSLLAPSKCSHTEQQWLLDQKDSLEEKIERAYAQFERGEFSSSEEFRTNMEKRKAQWLAEQNRS